MATRRHHTRLEAAIGGDSSLTQLDHDLARCRRRERRLWRSYQRIGEKRDAAASAAAHRTWSDTMDDALKVADAISREQARDIGELLLQFDAIVWWIAVDDNVLDGATRHWLKRFRRSLRKLAAQG